MGLAITTILCYDSSKAIFSPSTSERITSYALLSPHLFTPSQFIRLSYSDYHYCAVSTSTQRPHTLPPSTTSNDTKTPTQPLQDTSSRSVSSDDSTIYQSYFFSSLVDIGSMMILTMMILPSILIITLTILPMMFVMLPAVPSNHKEQDVFHHDKNTNTARPPTSSMPTPLTASPSSPSSSKQSGKRDELCLRRRQFWAFIQKLHYSRIGSSCLGFQWITAILYKLSMTVWTLWQFHNEGVYSSSAAWQLLRGVLQ